MKNVLLADDHVLYRECLKLVLKECFPKVRVQQVSDWAEAHHVSKDKQFDLALMDLRMPSEGTWANELHTFIENNRQVPVCVMSALTNPVNIKQAYDVGAKGYVTKCQPLEEVKLAILQISKGQHYFPREIWPLGATSDTKTKSALSQRQQEILMLVELGHSNKKIASELGLTEGTVKRHIYNIFKILGVKNRSEAIKSAQLKGIIND